MQIKVISKNKNTIFALAFVSLAKYNDFINKLTDARDKTKIAETKERISGLIQALNNNLTTKHTEVGYAYITRVNESLMAELSNIIFNIF